jgi:hypothetical protein
MRISDIRVILEIFIAEARLRCLKPIANRMAGNRMSWPQKKADPHRNLTAVVQETTELYLNPRSSRKVGLPARTDGGSLAETLVHRECRCLSSHHDQCK